MDLLTKNITAFFSAALISRLLCCCSLLKDFMLPAAVETSFIKLHVKYAILFFLFFFKRLCLMGIGGDLQLSYLANPPSSRCDSSGSFYCIFIHKHEVCSWFRQNGPAEDRFPRAAEAERLCSSPLLLCWMHSFAFSKHATAS